MKCPGQDTQYWKPGAIYDAKCPKCEQIVEFFKDDTMRKCSNCGHRFINPQLDFGCASYCQFAEQCIGNLPPELIAQKEDLLKDRVAIEMKKYFRTDFKRISNAGGLPDTRTESVKAKMATSPSYSRRPICTILELLRLKRNITVQPLNTMNRKGFRLPGEFLKNSVRPNRWLKRSVI